MAFYSRSVPVSGCCIPSLSDFPSRFTELDAIRDIDCHVSLHADPRRSIRGGCEPTSAAGEQPRRGEQGKAETA